MAPNVSKVDTLEQKHTDYIRQLVDTRYDKNLDCAVTSWYRVYQSLQAAFPELTTTVYYVRKAGRDVLCEVSLQWPRRFLADALGEQRSPVTSSPPIRLKSPRMTTV